MRIVLLKPGDERLLCRAEALFNQAPSLERAAMLLREPTYVMVVALTDDDEIMSRIYGHILHRAEATDFLLYEVDTLDTFYRQGAARAILEYLLALGRQHGWREMWVLTELDNAAGNALYRAVGGNLEDSPANMYVFSVSG